MSFKSLDLQMSIPRTPEAGGIQSQLAQRPVVDQTRLAAATAEQTVELRRKNTAVEESRNETIRGRDGRRQGGQPHGHGKDGRSEADGLQTPEAATSHPYKGKHIDVSL